MPAELGRPLRVGLYARVSTRDRDQNPAVQLDMLREYVVARGWVATEYVDLAPAGDLARRTAWARLLTDARQHRLDRVIVLRLDRAFRSTIHALRTLEAFEAAGVGFTCLVQDIDTTTSAGKLTFTILAAVAELERRLIADRVREGMAHARRQGKQLGRPRVQDRPGFAERWARVAPELAAGRISQRQAARRLRVGQGTVARLLRAAPEGEVPPGGSG